MANQEQLEILKQGVEVWNKWREENLSTKINLSYADLREADLGFANLSEANLGFADFTGANLGEANLGRAILICTFDSANLRKASLRNSNLTVASLREADLSGSNLTHASLIETDLKGAQLIEAELEEANLMGTDFSGANLTNSNLSGAFLWKANLTKANLSGAALSNTSLNNIDFGSTLGLEEVHHLTSSSISTDTIRISKGKLPIAFLRGCGLSDLEIEYAKLATPGLGEEQVVDISHKIHQLYLGNVIQYYSCFISYSSKDNDFAKKLHDDLQNNGVRCWFAPEDMKIGDKFRSRIDNAIRLHDKLLIILSDNSIKSAWVEKEVETAFEKERKEGCAVLFPVRLDDGVMNTEQSWAADIRRTRHVGDFSDWMDKSIYKTTFERLLRDLKATG